MEILVFSFIRYDMPRRRGHGTRRRYAQAAWLIVVTAVVVLDMVHAFKTTGHIPILEPFMAAAVVGFIFKGLLGCLVDMYDDFEK